jgi:hypothetical protein
MIRETFKNLSRRMGCTSGDGDGIIIEESTFDVKTAKGGRAEAQPPDLRFNLCLSEQ